MQVTQIYAHFAPAYDQDIEKLTIQATQTAMASTGKKMILLELIKKGRRITIQELRVNLSRILKSRQTYFVAHQDKTLKAVIPYDTLLELLEVSEKLYDAAMIQEVAQ